MATAQEVGLTVLQAARAQAAIARLQAQGRVGGRFQRVARTSAQEDAAFSVSVHTHDGPQGNGRTIIVETARANLLLRRTVGEGPHGETTDGWRVIDLSRVV